MKFVIVLLMLLCAFGCNEAVKTNTPTINQQITPAPQKWKDTFGDTLETQMVFNLALLRNNQFKIAATIEELHPISDSNEK